MKALFSYVHWGRVLLTGILIAILVVILNTVLFLLAIHVWGQPDQSQVVLQVTFWITSIVGILLTVGCTVWVVRKIERKAPLHGLLVGLVASLILFLLSPGFQGSLYQAALLTFVLMIVGGWLGGVLGSREQKKT